MTQSAKVSSTNMKCALNKSQVSISTSSSMYFGVLIEMQDYNLIACQAALKRIKEKRSAYKGEDVDRNLVLISETSNQCRLKEFLTLLKK